MSSDDFPAFVGPIIYGVAGGERGGQPGQFVVQIFSEGGELAAGGEFHFFFREVEFEFEQ